MIEALSAVTLATHDMARAVAFYHALGFKVVHGGDDAAFTSFAAGPGYLNLTVAPEGAELGWWGRAIFHVDDVDETYQAALAAGLTPTTEPRDAEWGERYFHITDPDGHELSFARPIG